MPTGYTGELYDGKKVKFEDFALRCARAFGALILMRDEPMDAKIPDRFEPSSYHVEALAKAKRLLPVAEGMSTAQAEKKSEAEFDKEMKHFNESIMESARRRKNYQDMIRQVNAWTPPTKDHTRLKEFMLEQLTSSIDFDCHEPTKPFMQSGAEYRRDLIAQTKNDIKYHQDALNKEVELAMERTAWVKALRDSLRGNYV